MRNQWQGKIWDTGSKIHSSTNMIQSASNIQGRKCAAAEFTFNAVRRMGGVVASRQSEFHALRFDCESLKW